MPAFLLLGRLHGAISVRVTVIFDLMKINLFFRFWKLSDWHRWRFIWEILISCNWGITVFSCLWFLSQHNLSDWIGSHFFAHAVLLVLFGNILLLNSIKLILFVVIGGQNNAGFWFAGKSIFFDAIAGVSPRGHLNVLQVVFPALIAKQLIMLLPFA